ncbi:integrase core domain-containing protein [Paracoccus sp. 08]|uniref:integrase core domain-containing protein n=1 Tax=Paracoccus sp. 08 TaxID=2606624 RepID=UPI003372B7C3|nr:transposase [Paracoccus sp. 08]
MKDAQSQDRAGRYECVCLRAFDAGSQVKAGIGQWFILYNHRRPHVAHGGRPAWASPTASKAISRRWQ